MPKNELQSYNIERLKEMCKSYCINAMGIYIYNKELFIKERDIDLNKPRINLNTTPKLTNKKRARGKNDTNSNLKACPNTVSSSRRKKRGYSQVNLQ